MNFFYVQKPALKLSSVTLTRKTFINSNLLFNINSSPDKMVASIIISCNGLNILLANILIVCLIAPDSS